ncbi:hypothetical protein DYE49_05340 [Treponema rectale]|uniref:ABC-type lipoprotein release transport system permease subunit n=1 Tax=Treponema rectale TaxID=744512 RepID=A0A840S752_9SPIR|nr:FtsX-like permease family protein [Treponema rectale]MBB5218399.1 ABC-type lipoprotein release transport system permease subunit [Treponema rectale]QOS39908.1 hypothetical protein DYE49_05340 [Treponema rectale]
MNVSLKLSLRSFLYRKKQYLSLFLVCLFGCGISLFFLFVMNGMMDSLKNKARIYYGGDIQIIGGKTELKVNNSTPFIEKIKNVFPENAVIVQRFDYDAARASFYFEGNSARQRVIKGVYFDREKKLFSGMNFRSGSSSDAGKGKILLSVPVAAMLCASVGDRITLTVPSSGGSVSTVDLTVCGIFEDSSLFGMYTSYMDIDDLRKVVRMPEDYANRICINLDSKNISRKDKVSYYKKLSSVLNMFPMLDDKQDFYDELLGGKFKKDTYAMIPLEANLQDVNFLIIAMHSVTFFIIFILIAIIVIGIGSTWKILVMKRINEIGIYMSLGMKKLSIIFVLLIEALILILSGCLCGTFFSLAGCYVISRFNFSFIPAFDIFLTEGSIIPVFDFSAVCIITALILFFTLAAVLSSIRKTIRIMPCQALAATE